MLALLAVEHGAFRDQVRAQERRVDVFEPRVAVGAVDQRLILRAQRELVAADVDHEVGRIGFAVRVDLLQRAIECALRRQRAGDPLEHAEVGLLEVELSVERRIARLIAVPRSESAGDGDLSGRHAVGQRRLERPRLQRAHVVHGQVMDRPDLRLLVLLFGDDDQPRVVGVDAVQDHAAALERVVALLLGRLMVLVGWLRRAAGRAACGLRARARFFVELVLDRLLALAFGLRRNVDRQSRQLHVVGMLAHQPEQAGIDVERLDPDERWHIVRRAAAADPEIRAFRAHRRPDAQMQIAELDVAVELVRECSNDTVAQGI